METCIEDVMNKQPRTCSADVKAIDAMQVAASAHISHVINITAKP